MRSCLVLGAATCVWDDLNAALAVGQYDAVIAAKLAGIAWPGEIYAWVSLHPEWMADYRKRRLGMGYPEPREVVAHRMYPGVDRVAEPRWPEQGERSGSSGMFAAKVALEDGFERVVLCGVPMAPDIGRIDGRRGWASARRYQEAVTLSLHHLNGKVRSMSGWTKEVLGAPTPEWLLG